MSEYPEDCTLAIEGLPFHAGESTFLPALVTCFGKWDVVSVVRLVADLLVPCADAARAQR